MRIVSVASAFPPHYYPQQTLTAAFKQYWGERLPNPDILDRLHTNAGVDGRHLALPMGQYLGLETWGQANDFWIEKAEDLGEQAICRAITRAGIAPLDIDALFFTSITGISSPSIDARLVNRMKLSPHIRRTPIFGLGCVGGAAGIARAADYVRGRPDDVAVLLSVELCSLTLQRDDLSIANLISSGLFGDGAAAVVVAGSNCGLPGPEIIDTRSIFYPNTEDVMGWEVSENGFTIVLSAGVADMVRMHLAEDVDAFLGDLGMRISDIGSWILHTGGPRVLEAMEEALGLENNELLPSWKALRRTGNLSSASVLVVLEDFLRKQLAAPGSYSILAAMGPGFSAELILLRW